MSRRSPPGQLFHEVEVLLGLCGRKGDVGAEATALAVMHEAGLTLAQVVVMSIVRHSGTQGMTITALAEALGLSMSATSALIQRLVDADLVRRDEMEADRRQKCISLTRAGIVLIDRVAAQRASEIARGVAGLPPPLREDLLDVLERVVDHLRVHPPHTSS